MDAALEATAHRGNLIQLERSERLPNWPGITEETAATAIDFAEVPESGRIDEPGRAPF